MLSEKTIQVVKSTAPFLQENGEALTRHFYKRMFSHNPEVLPFFNPAHQHAGTQQRALANAVAAYAANIDNLGALGPAVEIMAQKHVSLQVKPEHYAIVGENLLESIKELLGDEATKELIDAWAEAYGFLANILIAREGEIYKEQKQQANGWEGFRKFTIDRKEKESDIITSFYLKPADGGSLPNYKPGQYITIQASHPTSGTTMRNYSLSDVPGRDYLRISVKKETGEKADSPKGYVSNWLHDSVNVGSTVNVAPPCGEFYLDTSKPSITPLVLMAGGIGITPILSILITSLVKNPDRPIVLIHANRQEKVQSFKAVIDALTNQYNNLKVYYRYSETGTSETREGNASSGFVDEPYLKTLSLQKDWDYYFCGPKTFMANIYYILNQWGVDKSHMHYEFFGPLQGMTTTEAAA